MSDITFSKIVDGPAIRTFLDGSEYWVADLPTVRIGLGHFRPGWVWSEHAGAQTDLPSASHIGIIQSGAMMIETASGTKVELGPGDAFEVGRDHNAWVIGDELCVALDITSR